MKGRGDRISTPPNPDMVPTETSVTPGAGSIAGQLLSNRYRVIRELGSGGFATVYLAEDEKLVSKPVVVKVLNHLRADAWAVRKFHQEIEALARIDHPGVVAVLDEGLTADSTPFLVMQFVDGVPLRSLVRRGGMEIPMAAAILRQVGSALGAAHAKGINHRDLKPENIMVQTTDAEPRVKLIDFGIAGIKDSVFAHEDQSTRIAGTYRYMPPEQLEGRVCVESDIYAFGAIAFEMLTGQSAVKSPMELIAMKVEGLKVKPRDLRPELPQQAQTIILKALAFETSQRYSNAREMGDLLAAALLPVEPVTSATPAHPVSADRLEIAHVLFLDLVGFSALTMEDQRGLLDALQALVRGTTHFRQAEQAGDLIALPTGDGMALVFFGNPIPAAECALEIASAARENPAIRLRTGLHSGPVYRVADINKNLNVTGGGINMAQRVMDAGDAGHILVSATAAETLTQFGGWKDRLSDLGEHAVKHGAMIHFFNLCTEEAGNPAWPGKWAKPQAAAKSRRGLLAGVITVAAAIAGVGIYIAERPKEAPAKLPVVVAPPPPAALELEYSILVIRPDGKESRYSSERIFPVGYKVGLEIRAPKPGFLYVLDDGPLPPDGVIVTSIQHPYVGTSAQLTGGKTHQLPPSVLDEAHGNEDLYVVWSEKEVPEMEAVKDRKDLLLKNHVVLRDAVREATLKFLTSNQVAASGIKNDEAAGKTVLSTQAAVLVHHIPLVHD